MKTISWKEWQDTYKPIPNPNDSDTGFWGNMFETFGQDLDYMKENVKDNRHIWTIVDNNPNSVYLDLESGIHWFNRMGYFVTEVPWTEDVLVTNDPSNKEG